MASIKKQKYNSHGDFITMIVHTWKLKSHSQDYSVKKQVIEPLSINIPLKSGIGP